MEKHYLKVYEVPGSKEYIPQIRLSGKWLEKLGYKIGDNIVVSCSDNEITIKHAAHVSPDTV